MKFSVHILCVYLLLLVALPSVRAMKMLTSQNCEQTCHTSGSESSGCEKGKIIMSLNFSPVQFVGELDFKPEITFPEFKIEKEQSNYEKIFISRYQHSIWHPPKFFIS
ncbi:hypothetical protein [Flavobacterium cyclinae]|uniref:hypothetical protein n=1 Tax=Flavobacterium cyclinae TaxID=2895947 RepID=UPI001E63E8F7|nr:hypothetical protein [Flavobacterium cyclinae]UGS20500.1 hypothetical protein LOS86_10780 [Flavobacterium cyclinae]